MEQRYPLARLATLVTAVRRSGRPTRVVIRNTDRVGLVHLYFSGGQLVQVTGHRGNGIVNLGDVATWVNGELRTDDVQQTQTDEASVLEFEAAFDDMLRQLAARGVVTLPSEAPPSPVAPSPPPSPVSGIPGAPRLAGLSKNIGPRSIPAHGPLRTPGVQGTSGLPVLAEAPQSSPLTPMPDVSSADEALTRPQWQLLALAVHQVMERAARDVSMEVAGGLLWQALAHLKAQNPWLAAFDLDSAGWLQLSREDALAHVASYEVVEAIAALLTEYETRCAMLTGGAAARRIIVEATEPLRVSLAQIGLDVRATS